MSSSRWRIENLQAKKLETYDMSHITTITKVDVIGQASNSQDIVILIHREISAPLFRR